MGVDAGTVKLARTLAAGRVAIGSSMVLAPELSARLWIGTAAAGRPGSRVLMQALGIRDAAIGVGILIAAGSDAARPWLLSGVASDAVDLVATLRAGAGIPPAARAGVGALAAGSVLCGLLVSARS